MKYQVVSVDMPGYGKTKAKKRQSFRTIHVLDKGGPAETIVTLVKTMGLKKSVLVGYDWGGNVALRLGVAYPKLFSFIVAFMPAYGEGEYNKDELKRLKVPTKILWVKQDSIHCWPKFKKYALKIPKVKIDLVDVKKWKSHFADNMYSKISDRLTVSIYKFITGIDLSKSKQKALVGKEEKIKSTSNKTITSV